MLRTSFSLLFTMLLSFHAVSYVSAAVNIVSSVSRIDLKGGRIAGENADYYLDIPTMWSGYLIADRERFVNTVTPLEKLNFYYMPSDNKSKPALFLSMNIYGKFNYAPEPSHRKLLETNNYVFTVCLPKENSLSSKTDIAIFDNMRAAASDDQYLAGLIRLNKNDEKYFDNTIWVNGKQLNTKAITDSNITYLPIRDACEHLGYSVGWLPKQNAVTLSRGDTYEILLKNDINANHGFTLMFKNNITFISSLYFISVLKINVEIDERMNVTLNEG